MEFLKVRSPDSLDNRAVTQLWHACLGLGFEDQFPAQFRRKLHDALTKAAANPPRSNEFENAVAKALEGLKVPFQLQQFEEGYFLDIYIWKGDRRIAVECDGDRFHISRGRDGGAVFGDDALRERILERKGYDTLHLSSGNWNSVPKDKRQEFVDQKVREVMGNVKKYLQGQKY
jgi:hypothetical protein